MIYELRNYTLRPGARETLIELFEREFLESQEATGMEVVGQFRDQDAPDMFPWMRKFPDMGVRHQALEAFYGGPVWKANSAAANATMLDSDNVLLLRPFGTASFKRSERPPLGSTAEPKSLYAATIYHVEEGFGEYFERDVAPALRDAGVPPVACFETEHAENTFPGLPVRTGENVFVWFARFDRLADYRMPEVDGLADRLTEPAQILRLTPTPRSALR